MSEAPAQEAAVPEPVVPEQAGQEPPNDLAGALLALTTELIGAIRRETAALREMQFRELEPLQKEKARLVTLYRNELEQLRTGAAKLHPDSERKAELRAATAELADAAAENEKQLRASRTATERVMKVLVDAVRRHRRESSGYTAAATTRNGAACRINGVTVDHRL